MAFPILYFDTGGAATNSGSSDSNSPDLSGSAATVSGTTVTLDGSPDLSGLAADGSETIYLNDATNANRKIFRIVGADNGAKTVDVDVAPTGITSTSWAIGGRFLVASGSYNSVISGAFGAGWDGVWNNTPASHSGSDFITCRNSGDSTNGFARMRAAAGVRPVLTVSDTNNVVEGNNQVLWRFRGLEFAQQGGSGVVYDNPGRGFILDDVVISDGGGAAYNGGQATSTVIACEISGTVGGINNANQARVIGCYLHDASGTAIVSGDTNIVVAFNIIDTFTGRGLYLSGSPSSQVNHNYIAHNTIYGCGASGLEVTDADYQLVLLNNIFQDNGDGAGEYNVYWTAGSAENVGWHDFNLFYHQGGGGAGNLSGLTANDNELTDDPLFVDAANGDFRLKAGSPARGAGFPGQFLGGPLGHLDIGAVQMRTLPFENLHAIESGI